MSWLRRLWHRNRLEQELDKELRFHLERQIQDLIAQGTPPDEAKRQAWLMFGGPEQIKEACRDERGARWLQDFLRDCQYGIRLLRRSPAFTCAAVLSLALGIGANTAIFSLMDLVMLRMMPVREPERLVQFTRHHPEYGRGNISYPLFAAFERDLKSFDGLLAQSTVGRREVFISRQPEDAEIELVSGSLNSAHAACAGTGVCRDGLRDLVPAPRQGTHHCADGDLRPATDCYWLVWPDAAQHVLRRYRLQSARCLPVLPEHRQGWVPRRELGRSPGPHSEITAEAARRDIRKPCVAAAHQRRWMGRQSLRGRVLPRA